MSTAGAQPVLLRVTEIFLSLQGETSRAGLPTVFVRLAGCPLRCVWCDTAYAFHGGRNLSIDEILAQVAIHGTRRVCVTGGEPLAQKGCPPLLTALCEAGHEVSLETSGALDIAGLDPRIVIVMDLKAPGSGEVRKNRWTNLDHLKPGDELKLVLADAADYAWAREQIERHGLARRCALLLSPVAGRLSPRELAEWILRDRLPVRMQLQIHKILWGDVPGH